MIADATPNPALTSRSKFFAEAFGAVVIAVVVVADQVSKRLAIARLIDGPTDAPGPFWFRLVANRGALMGIPVPSLLLLAGTGVVLVMAWSALANGASRLTIVGWGLIVGGSAGNLADRFQQRRRFPDHAVVDWIASTFLPTFNLADVAIVAGLAIVTLTTGARASARTRNQETRS